MYINKLTNMYVLFVFVQQFILYFFVAGKAMMLRSI